MNISKYGIWHVTFTAHDSFQYDGERADIAQKQDDAGRSRRSIPKRRDNRKVK